MIEKPEELWHGFRGDERNAWLAHWEERWAATRIHGRKKRQVLVMFAEEKPALKALPATRFRYFRETSHTAVVCGSLWVDLHV